MYLNRKKMLMVLSLINMYLKEHSWKDLELFKDELVERLMKK